MKHDNLKSYVLMGLLVFVVSVFLPADAMAAGDIFTIIAKKMGQAVLDIRQIVYVIAGFGLIMFAFLAIFNKISFKHLGYLSIGLFLLSVMIPFINYFAGLNMTERDFAFGDHTRGQDNKIIGSDVGSMADCTPESCPKAEGIGISGGIGSAGDIGGGVLGGMKDPFGGVGGPVMDPNISGVAVGDQGWDASGCRNGADGKKECCEGKMKDGKCKKTTKQALKDLVSAGKSVISAGKNAMDVYEQGKGAVTAGIDGVSKIGDAIKNGDGFFDTMGDVAAIAGQTGNKVGSNLSLSMGHIGLGMDDVSDLAQNVSTNYENNPTGKNKVSDGLDNSPIHDTIEKGQDAVDGVRKDVGDYAGYGKDAAGLARRGQAMGKKIDGWFGGNK